MPRSKYDYPTLERQYIRGTMSVRQLCIDNGIKTWSTVNEYARRNAWAEKREHFQSELMVAETKAVVGKRADRLARVIDDSIDIASAAVWSFFDSLKDRWVTDPESGKRVLIPGQQIPAADFIKVLEKIMLLDGQVTSREAHLNLNATTEIPTMEALRELASVARQLGADARPVQSSPLPRLAGPGEVN